MAAESLAQVKMGTEALALCIAGVLSAIHRFCPHSERA